MNPEFRAEDYSYLWSNYEVNYIVNSCRFAEHFAAQDIILTNDNSKKELRFFMSKSDHAKIALETAQLFLTDFDGWLKTFIDQMRVCERLMSEMKHESHVIEKMPTDELAAHFFARTKALELFLDNYWYYTNFFSVAECERLIASDPDTYATLAKNLEHLGHIKYEGRGVLNAYMSFVEVFAPYVREMQRRYERNDIESLSVDEIRALVAGDNVPQSLRGESDWIVAKRTDWKCVYGDDAHKIMQALNASAFGTDVKELRGTIASKGVYRGRVRILRIIYSESTQYEAAKLIDGEVLVANSTGPELMSACQRAGAIVTDEGGLTSHAAVVSRELKIPCIVGTKTGSKVFKDGDVVEVDADNGIVRKI